MASAVESPRRFIRVKRKASEAVDTTTFKKLKFVGSANKGDDQTVKELIVTKTPSLAVFDEDFMITDYEDFVFRQDFVIKQKDKQLLEKPQVLKGMPMIAAHSNIGLEEEPEDMDDKYVYDVYLYEEPERENNDVLVADEGAREADYSSNDEDNPDNDYPDDDDCDSDEYDYYRDYEDDETREMMTEFAKHCLDPDKLDRDNDSLSDESWAKDEY